MTEGRVVTPWARSGGDWLQKGMRGHAEVMEMLSNVIAVEAAHFQNLWNSIITMVIFYSL